MYILFISVYLTLSAQSSITKKLEQNLLMKTLKQNKNLNFKINNSQFCQRDLIWWNLIQIDFIQINLSISSQKIESI